jgi:hypothetical protein
MEKKRSNELADLLHQKTKQCVKIQVPPYTLVVQVVPDYCSPRCLSPLCVFSLCVLCEYTEMKTLYDKLKRRMMINPLPVRSPDLSIAGDSYPPLQQQQQSQQQQIQFQQRDEYHFVPPSGINIPSNMNAQRQPFSTPRPPYPPPFPLDTPIPHGSVCIPLSPYS